MKTKQLPVLLACILSSLSLFSQSVAVNNDGTPADPSAMLDVKSITKGFLFPRMSTQEREEIVNPAMGLMVYDTDDGHIFHYRGPVHGWQKVGAENWDRNFNTVFTFYNVAINGVEETDPSALLDINSSTKGVLFPRMTTVQRNAIVNPAIGLMVYDTWLNGLYIFRNGTWSEIVEQVWQKNNPDIYFSTGKVGIGTSTPQSSLHIRSGASVTLASHGYFLIGQELGFNIAFDNDEIQARQGAVASPLVLQRYGNMVQIGAGTQNATTSLFIPQGEEAALTAVSSGFIMMGQTASQNLIMDNNEIQSRNNGSAATMYLQNEGGRLQAGSPLGQYMWFENNEIQGRSGAINFELVLQNDGSRVRVGSGTDAGNAKLLVLGGTDVGLADNQSGFVMMGTVDGTNIAMDNNEIQARSNGAAATLAINNNGGGVRIGPADIPAGFMLSVDGNIICEELQVKLSGDWADYVFEETYKLRPLEELEKFIATNKHLPGIPAAKKIEEKGLAIGDMQKMQMEKIEELTLYIIDLNKQMKELKADNEKMQKKISELEKK